MDTQPSRWRVIALLAGASLLYFGLPVLFIKGRVKPLPLAVGYFTLMHWSVL